MGYETDTYYKKCGCSRTVVQHDFFGGSETTYYKCNYHLEEVQMQEITRLQNEIKTSN